MRDNNGEDNPGCYFHPKEVVVGICALCLKERLLVLASKQDHLPQPTGTSQRSFRRKPSINLPKIFALGSFLQLADNRHDQSKKDDSHDEASIASLEDSFISIKFEDNGHASWPNKKAINTIPSTRITCGSGIAVARESKGRNSMALRWRIGYLLQIAHWKRPNKASTSHVGCGSKVDRLKGRRGWIRSLTSKRTTTSTD